jgi:hypothetical protein
MQKLAFLMPFLFVAQLVTSQQQPLFKITQKGKTGYINSAGTTVIPTIYHNGFDFAEGLAAVRENGLYGFIDASGKYIIAPQFDYATYFVNGITLVYKNRKSYFIDKTGSILFPPVYRSMKFIDDRKAVITTKTNKAGIIDVRTGRLLADTLYGHIGDFNNGLAVISSYDPSKNEYIQMPQAVIDTACNFIVPFGKFEYVGDFHDGYASVTVDFENDVHGVIDVTGRLLKKKTPINSWNISGSFYEGISKFYHYDWPNSYEGFIDLKGDTILDDPNYRGVNDFSCGRATAIDHNDNWFVLDRHGKKVGNQSFEYIQEKFFKNYAIVKTSTGYGIIDTNARFIIQPQYKFIRFPDSTVEYFFFSIPDEKEEYKEKYGVANLNNQVIIQPVMKYSEERGFVNGLLHATVNGLDTWLNKQGNIVWQEPIEDEQAIRTLNIDYMGVSHYDAERPLNSTNYFADNEFIFKIDTSIIDTAADRYYAYKLIVGNSTKQTIKLLSISSTLAMRFEALDEDGAWKKIEDLHFSSHTNGYSITSMAPGTYWPFKIPRYAGSFPTKIRAALWYEDKNEQVQFIYSNTINASINKTQFWRDFSYPEGISDPRSYDRTVDMTKVGKNTYSYFGY